MHEIWRYTRTLLAVSKIEKCSRQSAKPHRLQPHILKLWGGAESGRRPILHHPGDQAVPHPGGSTRDLKYWTRYCTFSMIMGNIYIYIYYSYSYSGTILNPNIIRIRIRPNICARILFVFVFAHSEKTNIIRIRIRSKFWFRIIFVFVFGPKNSIRSPLWQKLWESLGWKG